MEKFPSILYHSISQARLKEAAGLDQLPGHSRLHHDPSQNLRGIWLGDELKPLLEAHHGLEHSDEVIGTLPLPSGEVLEVKKPIPPVILQIEGLDENQISPHIIDPHQFFYKGGIDWAKIKKFLVTDVDPEVKDFAKEFAEQLKKEKGIDVEVQTYDPSEITRDESRGKYQQGVSKV